MDTINDTLVNGAEDALKDKYLLFYVGEQVYGIEICHVAEIIPYMDERDVPGVASFIRGAINLRGIVVPLMDVRVRFGLPSKDIDATTCVVVVHYRNLQVGLMVDNVIEVLHMEASRIEANKDLNDGSFVSGLGKVDSGVKLVLDLNRLLFDGLEYFAGDSV